MNPMKRIWILHQHDDTTKQEAKMWTKAIPTMTTGQRNVQQVLHKSSGSMQTARQQRRTTEIRATVVRGEAG
jgi:hypothetical protein